MVGPVLVWLLINSFNSIHLLYYYFGIAGDDVT